MVPKSPLPKILWKWAFRSPIKLTSSPMSMGPELGSQPQDKCWKPIGPSRDPPPFSSLSFQNWLWGSQCKQKAHQGFFFFLFIFFNFYFGFFLLWLRTSAAFCFLAFFFLLYLVYAFLECRNGESWIYRGKISLFFIWNMFKRTFVKTWRVGLACKYN